MLMLQSAIKLRCWFSCFE